MKTMKQMGRKTLSLLLAAVFCLGILPARAATLGTIQAPNTGDGRLKAYAKALEAFSNMELCLDPSGYQFMNEEEFEPRFDGGTGKQRIYALILLDCDGDGKDEMLVIYNEDATSLNWQLWGYDGQNAKLLDSGESYGYAREGSISWRLHTRADGSVCLTDADDYGHMGYNMSRYVSYVVQGLTVHDQVDMWEMMSDDMNGSFSYSDSNGHTKEVTYDDAYSDTDIMRWQKAIDDPYDDDILLFYGFGGGFTIDLYMTPEAVELTYLSLAKLNGQSEDAAATLSRIHYTGDPSACRMTAAQAQAFVDIIEQQQQIVNSQIPGNAFASYFNAALFDAGDGIPALWLCGGYAPYDDYVYHDVVNGIWAWDGTRAVLDFQDGRNSRLTDRGIVHIGFWTEMSSPYLGIGGVGEYDYNSALFPLSHGRVSKTAAQTSAYLVFEQPASTEQFRSRILEYDRSGYAGMDSIWISGLTYDFTTTTDEYYEEYGAWYHHYTINGSTGTNGLSWANTLLRCEREKLSQWVTGSTMASALRAYAETAAVPAYTFPEVGETDAHYRDVAQAASGRGTVQAVYRLLEDLYYVLLENQGAYSGAVVRGVTRNGRPAWEVSQVDEEPAGESDLEALLNRLLSASNLTPDFSKLRGSPTVEDLTAYLRELLENYDGLSPNDAAKTELAAFLDSAVAAVASDSVSGKDNRLTLNRLLASVLADKAKSAWADLLAVLSSAGVALNKTVTPRARLLWQDVDPDQACQLTVDKSLVSGLNGADLQVLLGSVDRYVQLSADSLRRLTDELETFSVQFSRTGSNTYSINFLDKDGQVLDRLPSPIILGLPAPSMTSTVMVSYAGGSDNWGGQYDGASGVLAFETRYSGQYEVLENNIQIDDITDLSEESQAAIRFMVSKGYLTLDENGLFDPRLPMTRYDFTRTLVSMFFALDRSLSTSFTDVPGSSGYYDYVASAEANQLVQGIEETIFGGEEYLQVEQMLTITGRTLSERKGYALPRDAEQYLSAFGDGGEISDWAQLHTALSVREGLWDRSGMLYPQSEVTREQAAVTLYRLFLRLYEVPPVALDLPPASAADNGLLSLFNGSAAIAAGAAVVIAAGAGAAVVIGKKRKAAAGKES